VSRLRQRRAVLILAPISFGFALSSAQAATPSIPMSVLKQCAEINDPSKRLACYDQVAERPPATSAAVPKDSPAAKVSPAASAPAAAAASAATTAPPPKESFGLYSAEHPAAPPRVEALISARVISIGISSTGRSTVTLEGDQVWELDSADPVLKNGDAVTVKRGTLGSFILTTPAGRLHRAHRIR
jgi:hypothetical protein